MTLLERQRRESFMKGMFIPFMLLALVCSLFGDTNILHADVQKVVVYDSGSALTDMQKQSPVILESFEFCQFLLCISDGLSNIAFFRGGMDSGYIALYAVDFALFIAA